MRTLITATVAACAIASGATIAAATPDPAVFDRALDSDHVREASAMLDEIIDARLPKDGIPRADPELNDMLGRLALRRGDPDVALAFLLASRRPGLNATDEARSTFGEAQARLARGDLADAVVAFDRVLSAKVSPETHAAAARGRIEALLASDPSRARRELALLGPLRATDTAHSWHWALLEAQAASLAGDTQGARTAAAVAWAGTVGVPLLAISAPARVAALQGAIAAQAGERDRAISLFAVAARAAGNDGEMGVNLAEQLPVCGGVVTRDDRVTVSLFRDDRANITRITPLTATRPSIVATFLNGLRADRLANTLALTGAAVVLDLRCRTAPARRAAGRHLPPSSSATWFATKGLLPRVGFDGDDTIMINAAATRVDTLTARYGPDSVLLLGPLIRLVELTEARLRTRGDVSPTRVATLGATIGRLFGKAGGAEGFAPPGAVPIEIFARARATTTPAAATTIISAGYRAYLAAASFDLAYATYRSTPDTAFVTPAQRIDLLAALAARARTTTAANDPRRAALELDRIEAARAVQDGAGVRSVARGAGLGTDLCAVSDTAPTLRDNAITTDDFPEQGIATGLAGLSILEFDIDARGTHTPPRTLVALPPLLFDPVVAQRQGALTFDAATQAGRPVACRGATTRIRWKYPEASDDTPAGAARGPWRPGI